MITTIPYRIYESKVNESYKIGQEQKSLVSSVSLSLTFEGHCQIFISSQF